MSMFIFITGGVLSSLGKGITAASIGALLEGMGHKVTFLKLDPYLNIDPGTMSPYQHGEVFVTNDGTETDLDLGHYERFTNVTLHKKNSITAGRLYSQLLDKERRGDFLGKTIQTVPHFTNEIKDAIYNVSGDNIISIIEIGGTVGDIESLPFLEAIRQINLERKHKNCVFIHLTYVPFISVASELKTKPTQHSVKELRSLGIQPDILICRSSMELSQDIKNKISLFTNVEESSIISAPDLESVYELPIYLEKQSLHKVLAEYLELEDKTPDLKKWADISNSLKTLKHETTIGIIGKYIEVKDAYKSIYEALTHAQIPINTKINVSMINSEDLTDDNIKEKLKDLDGILVPGGFGDRGIDGKIAAVNYARENKIPFFGICLGMQIAVIEFARNVLNLKNAHSTEFDLKTINPVVDILEAQKNIQYKGATMRLGDHPCKITKNTKTHAIYKNDKIEERHRHRYEFNPKYAELYSKAGLNISGFHEAGILPEIIEIPEHPFFVACQFHPEFKSKPFAAHPLFVAFSEAALKRNLQK